MLEAILCESFKGRSLVEQAKGGYRRYRTASPLRLSTELKTGSEMVGPLSA
jgi:hypothetical protein